MDTLTKERRSWLMARIRSRDTGPELRLRKALWASGLRYRKNHPGLPGRPDVVFTKQRICVFVDGCFWHGCPECYRPPKSNGEFWRRKVEGNRKRDAHQNRELASARWTVLRLWEHEVNRDLPVCMARIRALL